MGIDQTKDTFERHLKIIIINSNVKKEDWAFFLLILNIKVYMKCSIRTILNFANNIVASRNLKIRFAHSLLVFDMKCKMQLSVQCSGLRFFFSPFFSFPLR